MIKTFTSFVLDGYAAGELDFTTHLSQSSAELRAAFESEIIQPILDVLNSPDQTALLSVDGHADRVDDEGITREQRRVKELEASVERTQSAQLAVEQIVLSRMPEPHAASVEELQQFGMVLSFVGAARLAQGGEAPLSEGQRRENRAVSFKLARFSPT